LIDKKLAVDVPKEEVKVEVKGKKSKASKK
jgi:hypothetical protein